MFRSPALLLLALAAVGCSDPGPERPHLLLITVDTLRADRLGCYGWEKARTPTIDRLSAGGRTWETVVASAPVTLSATSTLMTGLDPTEHGARYNGFYELGEEVETLAEVLAARGYATAAIISNFSLDRRFGIAQGFASFDDRMTQRMRRDAPAEAVPPPEETDPDWWLRFHQTQNAQRYADEVTDAGLEWLERAGSGPHFLWLHYMDPHSPYDPPARYADLGGYSGEVAFVDEEIGRFLAAWDERFGGDDRLLVFTADHGESLGEHRIVGHVAGVYDAMLLVPLILHRPGVIEPGVRDARPLRGRDVKDLVLAALEPEPTWDAQDEASLAYSETFFDVVHERGGVLRSIRDGSWKLIEQDGRVELYRLDEDPGEERDVSGSLEERTARLLAELERIGAGKASPRGEIAPEELDRLRAMGYAE